MKAKDKDLELVKTIVLNGKIDRCHTGDDQEYGIGIKTINKQKRFNGTYTEFEMGYPFSQRLADEIGWGFNRADVTYLISDNPITDPEKAVGEFIEFVTGNPKVSRHHCYSDLTGYLWTDEKFVVGGHDLLNVLRVNIGKFIHIEMDLYRVKTK